MALDERVSKLEGAYEQVDARLGDLNRAIESLRLEMNTRLDQMDRKFTALFVMVGGAWVTLTAAFITLALTD